MQLIKKLKITLFSLIVFSFSGTASATEITAIDFFGNVIGQVISTGMVIDASGNNIGSITADSLIVNDKGIIIGGIVPQGIVIGNDNHFLGKIHNDGQVRSLGGKALGKALPNGLVINDVSQIIGFVLHPGLVYSPDGNAIGRVTGAGTYVSLDGQRNGFVSANGYAYRKSGDEFLLDGRLMSAKMVVSLGGKFIGSIAPTGMVVNFEGKEIGNIHANGYVYDTKGMIIGSIVSTSYAFDLSGNYIGLVSYNGEVRQADRVIGYYRADGNIADENNTVIGFAVNISATANDNQGKYLGYVAPGGLIVNGMETVGYVGARGYVYNQNKEKIGEINATGPLYDALAKLKGIAMKNGAVVSLSGADIGRMQGRYAFDSNGTLMGATTQLMVAIDNKNNALGAANIDAKIKSGSQVQKVSPFGYLFDSEGKISGNSFAMAPVYNLEGLIYSYLTPNADLYHSGTDMKVTQAGVLVNKAGYTGALIDSLYALGLKGQFIGNPAQTNVIMGKNGRIGYKVIDGGYVVESENAISPAVSPVKGFSSNKFIALSVGGDLLGYADSLGNVNDLSGHNLGRVTEHEYVIDNNHVVAGRLIPFAVVNNDKCAAIGVVNGRGDVVNNRDVIVGRLLANGQAISDVGSYIGYAQFGRGLVDFDGKFVGVVSAGKGIGLNGDALGCVNRSGEIFDGDGNLRYGVVINDSVIDFSGKIIGNVLANGQVVDGRNQIIGYMQPNGNVVSATKKVMGNVMRYKIAYTNNNDFLGLVQSSGQVIDGEGNVVGQIGFDGSVMHNGEVVGYGLYDFYVYDENFVTYGYLAKDGTVLSMVGSKLGKMDKGFVIDKRQQIVARGNRDYIVRDVEDNAVGVLQMDGNVIDFNGKNVGYLSEAGIIKNSAGEEVARATPLQYYVFAENGSGTAEQTDWADHRKVQINDATPYKAGTETAKSTGSSGFKQPQNLSSQVVGIALSPEGDVIGNIYADDTVKSADGTQIGFRTPDGIIVDMNYNPIGIEEVKHTSASEMFVPANAFGNGNAYGVGSQPTNLGPGGGYGQGERYDPVRSQALTQLQDARRRNIEVGNVRSNVKVSSFTGYEEDGWPGQGKNISTWRVDMSQMILEDKAIPAVLARSVYASENFGSNIPITAIVERNVYAEEGRNVIIPAGSRVIGSLGGGGETTGGNSGGAVKIGITWKRLIRPDGSQFTFGNAQTADAQGRAGAIGYLDEQLLKRYTMPLLTTALESSMAYIMAAGKGSTTTDTSSTEDARSQAAEDARQNFLDQMNTIFEEILERKANIRSVTYIPAGTRIIIFPNEDLWLNSEEREKAKEENGEDGSNNSGSGLVDESLRYSGSGDGNNVTYNGNYQENVRPVSAPNQTNSGRGPNGYVQPANAQNAASQTPPPSTAATGGNSNDVPELL